jgi:PAS domain S-box-containing protein
MDTLIDEAQAGMQADLIQGCEALQISALLSRLVEQTGDGVILTDTRGVIQYANPAFEAISGYSRAQVVDKTPRILKSGLHDAEFYRQMWEHVLRGYPFKGMVINRKRMGELYWTQRTITSMRDESGRLTHFVSVFQDITELRKKQEQKFHCNWRGQCSKASIHPLPLSQDLILAHR